MLGKIGSFIGIAFIVFVVIGIFTDDDSDDVKVVNLDIVLDEFIAAAEEMPAIDEESQEGDNSEAGSTFIKKYTAKLNEKNALEGDPVGVGIANDGSFVGFNDANKDGVKADDERAVFKVEVDAERSRLIATDLENSYHRDGSYRAGGTGFLAGYLVSRMLFRQRAAGVNTSKFKSMTMSKKGYHSSAKSSVRSSRSARSSGSGSFRSGK